MKYDVQANIIFFCRTNVLPEEIIKQSMCLLECDGLEDQIINREKIQGTVQAMKLILIS